MDVSSGDGIVKIDEVALSSYPSILNFDSGTAVAIEAIPDFGYVFSGWSGDLSGTTNPATLVVDCGKKVTATFSVDWSIVGLTTGSLLLVGLVVAVSLIRRRAG